jgi:hypothetical protein
MVRLSCEMVCKTPWLRGGLSAVNVDPYNVSGERTRPASVASRSKILLKPIVRRVLLPSKVEEPR